ncbi:MAG: caspase family protein [Rhodospirillaceae bacterium]|nr:caspase family protein [Rhodospirillaceae bacterium]
MAKSTPRDSVSLETLPYTRVSAIVVGLENFRPNPKGGVLDSVEYAHADAEAFRDTLQEIYSSLDEDSLQIELVKDSRASLTALRDTLAYTILNLSEDDLFIFYYAGHGFHDGNSNRLSAYDTSAFNPKETTLDLHDDILVHLSRSECERALLFIDACAATVREIAVGRDVISDLHLDDMKEFIDSALYCAVFLSCSPDEKSYSSPSLGHGIWTSFLLKALRGEADEALTRERWLTDYGLRDWLRREVPRYITRETEIRGTQRPRAIVSSSNTFQIRHVAAEEKLPQNLMLSNIVLKYSDAYLESVETGAIRGLEGFNSRIHTVPDKLSNSADAWVGRLLEETIADEVQAVYSDAKRALGFRRRDASRESDSGGGNVDTPVFRLLLEAKQNPNDPSEFAIYRLLFLRSGWEACREEIEGLFSGEFDRMVIEIESKSVGFSDLVDKLEDIEERNGGRLEEDEGKRRAVYLAENGAEFVIDLRRRRFEIVVPGRKGIELVDAVQEYQFGLTGDPNPMLPSPTRLLAVEGTSKRTSSARRRKPKRKKGT